MFAKLPVSPPPLARRQSLAAFTIIEVMVTVMIVAIVYLATMSTLSFARMTNSTEQERARAHQMVTEVMEQCQRDLFSCITSGTTQPIWDNGTPSDPSDDTIGTLQVVLRNAKTGAQITAFPGNQVLVKVEVSMSWHPRGRLSNKTLRETAVTFKAP